MPSDIGAVALPASIGHIGVVVEDIDKTMEFLSSTSTFTSFSSLLFLLYNWSYS